MLHIITPIFRFQYFQEIYNSLPPFEDIRWHIGKSDKREMLDKTLINNDERVIIYEVDCEDTEAFKKRRAVLENIQDGYFCFLDDDTIFHPNMYKKYLDCSNKNYEGMLIGEQINKEGHLRLKVNEPHFGKIDVGNVLCHTSCLKHCEWPTIHIPKINQKDFLFWRSVYEFYGKECIIWGHPISFYNKLV